MEAGRDPVRYVDVRHGRTLEITRINDHQIGRLFDRIKDEAEQPALVLGSPGMGGDKDEFAWITVRPEAMHFPDTGLQIVLKQAAGADKRRVGCFR